MKKSTLFLLILISTIFFSCSHTHEADLIIFNGPIYTAGTLNPQVEAVVVKDGKILFAGAYKEAERWHDHHTETINLHGNTMTPGFIDSHAHLLGIGYGKMKLDLMNTKSYDELLKMVEDAVSKAKPGEWIQGRGWHQSKWNPQPKKLINGFQIHDRLSAISPNNPVYLTHASGHAVFVNAKAMEIAGINKNTQNPEGGEIIRDRQGNATGIFTETAEDLIYAFVPVKTMEMRRKALRLAIEECVSHGLTGFYDAGSGKKDIEVYKEFIKNNELKLRLSVMLSGDRTELLREYFEKGPEIALGDNHLNIRAIKLYADGALGSRGAWLLAPYSDRPSTSGLAVNSMNKIHDIAVQGLKYGFQVCTHAIGDRANREVLNQYESAFAQFPNLKDPRFRIEHAQHLSLQDIPRFSKLGVLPVMQAIHMASDMPWAIQRLGEKRIAEGAYVWQKLIHTGVKIANGTDAPVEQVDPRASFYAAVARKTLSGEQMEWFHPEQAMTRQQALESYTINSAYSSFEEGIKGSIEKGKLADFTIWDKDIMKIPENEILTTDVIMTIVGGQVVYRH